MQEIYFMYHLKRIFFIFVMKPSKLNGKSEVIQCSIFQYKLIMLLIYFFPLQVTFTRNIVWTLSNLCRNKNPQPEFESVKACLPVLNRLLNYPDDDILSKLIFDQFGILNYVFSFSTDEKKLGQGNNSLKLYCSIIRRFHLDCLDLSDFQIPLSQSI